MRVLSHELCVKLRANFYQAGHEVVILREALQGSMDAGEGLGNKRCDQFGDILLFDGSVVPNVCWKGHREDGERDVVVEEALTVGSAAALSPTLVCGGLDHEADG